MGEESQSALYCSSCYNPAFGRDEQCTKCGAARPDDGWPVDSLVGQVLDNRFGLVRRVRADGMRIAFRAISVADDKRVVVKMLNPDQALDMEVTTAFIDDLKAAQGIDSTSFPPIVYVGDDFISSDLPYLVQEYVEGETLAELLARGLAYDIPEALQIVRNVALGLQKVHAKGLVHGHLRPDKILVRGVRDADSVTILDLGFSCVSPKDEITSPDLVDALRYMAPEQEEGKKDARTDVFALGVMLFELIAGQPPPGGPGESAVSTLQPICLRDYKPATTGKLDALVIGMMARDPAKRPVGMKAVVTSIDMISRELPRTTEPDKEPSEKHDDPEKKKIAKDLAKSRGRRLITGGSRMSAEVFSRPTKPPVKRPSEKVHSDAPTEDVDFSKVSMKEISLSDMPTTPDGDEEAHKKAPPKKESLAKVFAEKRAARDARKKPAAVPRPHFLDEPGAAKPPPIPGTDTRREDQVDLSDEPSADELFEPGSGSIMPISDEVEEEVDEYAPTGEVNPIEDLPSLPLDSKIAPSEAAGPPPGEEKSKSSIPVLVFAVGGAGLGLLVVVGIIVVWLVASRGGPEEVEGPVVEESAEQTVESAPAPDQPPAEVVEEPPSETAAEPEQEEGVVAEAVEAPVVEEEGRPEKKAGEKLAGGKKGKKEADKKGKKDKKEADKKEADKKDKKGKKDDWELL